jgi:hypothetical protein
MKRIALLIMAVQPVFFSFVNNNTRKMEMYTSDKEKEFKTMEIKFTRILEITGSDNLPRYLFSGFFLSLTLCKIISIILHSQKQNIIYGV